MLIIGERLNATRKQICSAIRERNEKFIADEAAAQLRAGAAMLDVNAGADPSEEKQHLCWLVETVLAATNAPLCLDSSSPDALEAALNVALKMISSSTCGSDPKVPRLMINSISAEQEKYIAILPLVKHHNTAVVALCMDESGVPNTVEERVIVGGRLVERLLSDKIVPENIYVDPLVVPVGVNPTSGVDVLNAAVQMKEKYPGIKTILGLSNISFGLPCRQLLNSAFLAIAVYAGVDAAIIDPLDKKLMSILKAALAVTGKDLYSTDYIAHFRAGNIV